MDDDLPQVRGPKDPLGHASRLAGEPLDSYSADELTARIRLLQAEIERVQAHAARGAEHRRLADSIFKGSGPARADS